LARPERPIAVMPDGRADPYRPSAEMRRPEDPGAEVRSDVLVAAVPVTVGSERRKPPPLCELLRHEERIEAHLRADRGLAEPYRQAFGFGRIRPRAVAGRAHREEHEDECQDLPHAGGVARETRHSLTLRSFLDLAGPSRPRPQGLCQADQCIC